MNTWRSFEHTEPRLGSTIEVVAYLPRDGVRLWHGRYVSMDYDQFILETTVAGATSFFWKHVDIPEYTQRGN